MQGKHQIGNVGAAGIIALALFFDAAQFVVTLIAMVPLLGLIGIPLAPVLTIVAYACILITLVVFFPDLDLMKGRQGLGKLAAMATPLVVELIPYLSAIPAITPGVVAFVIMTRIEDAGADPNASVSRLSAHKFEQSRKRNALATTTKERQDAIRSQAPRQEQERLLKDEERAAKKEARKITRGNVGALRKEFDLPKSRQDAPGMLAESVPQETGLSGFTEDLDRAA